jgi:hypothetical protein
MHDLNEELLEQAKLKEQKNEKMNDSFILISLTSPFSRKCIITSSFASLNLLFIFANA